MTLSFSLIAWVDPRHLIGDLGEHFIICFQELNELDSLSLFHVQANEKEAVRAWLIELRAN